MCIDGKKSYSYGAQYAPLTRISAYENKFLVQVFTWAQKSPSNAKNAQIIIWNLVNSNCANYGSDGYCRSGSSGTITGKLFNTITSKQQFIDRFLPVFKQSGELSGSLPAKWALPNSSYCDCIFKSAADIKNNTRAVQNCKSDKHIKYDTSDCSDKYCSSELDLDGIVYNYEKYTLSSELKKACSDIAQKSTPADKQKAWEDYYYGTNTESYQYWIQTGQAGNSNYAKMEAMYNQITSTPAGYTALEVYVPYSNGQVDTGVQRILAPVITEIVPNNCSNYLSHLKQLGYTQADLDNLEGFLHIKLVDKDTAQVKCASKVKDCNEQVKTYLFIKKLPNPNFTPKLNNKWIYIYDIQTQNGTLACKGCSTEAAKFISDYGGSCDTFKSKIEDPENIVECIEGVRVSCAGPNTCDSLITNSRYQGQVSQAIWQEFYNKISDKEKASYVGGKIYCTPPCDPDVKLDNGVCASKTEGKAWFELSDATDGGEPNKSCYQGGTAYNIENDIVASKENKLSNTYCDTYCWESLTAYMPWEPSSVGEPILAGQKVFWGTDYSQKQFGYMDTHRVCWNVPKYDTFKTNWYANEDSLALAYATYLAKEAYNADTDDSNVYESDGHCCMGGYDPGTAGSLLEYDSGSGCPSNCTTQKIPFPEGHPYYGLTYDHCVCGTAGTPESCADGWGKKYKKKEHSVDITSSSGNKQTGKSGEAESGCVTSKPSASSLTVSNSTGDVDKYLAERNNLKASIEACQTNNSIVGGSSGRSFNDNIYKYTAWVKVKSNDQLSKKDVNNTMLSTVVTYENVTNPSVPTGKNYYSCTDIGGFDDSSICDNPNSRIEVDNYKEFYWDYSGNASFVYTEEFHFYALKENANMVKKEKLPVNMDSDPELTYLKYDLGYGVPTAFTYGTGFYDLGVDMGGFGNDSHFDKVADVSGTKYGYSIKEYDCGFYVENKLYETPPCTYSCNQETKKCTKILDSPAQCCKNPPCKDIDGGINLVYRVIDMAAGDTKKIFPSVDGDGRDPGYNWSLFINTRANTYRNITTYKTVYDNTPMYSIDLTPTAIGTIRSSNTSYREAGKDPYTSYKDTNNKYKITCQHDGNSKTCVSKYITELIKRKIVTGKYAIESEGQRITSLYNYKSCYDVSNPTNC